jgi:uncharacterized protein YlbG (UPF0298 family)
MKNKDLEYFLLIIFINENHINKILNKIKHITLMLMLDLALTRENQS